LNRLGVCGEAAPVPEIGTFWGLPEALFVMVRIADFAPVLPGLKDTLNVHNAPAARLLPQSLICEKSDGFVPRIVTPETFNAALPEFFRVTVWVDAGLFVCCVPKSRESGDNAACGVGAAASSHWVTLG